jgi:DNA topoisomerase IB
MVQATLLPGMKIKDLRTIAASDLAEKTLGSIKPTLTGNAKTDAREIGRINKEVSATVATKLNNAPAQAFKSYIAPTLFMAWGKNNGVPPEWLVTLSPKGK